MGEFHVTSQGEVINTNTYCTRLTNNNSDVYCMLIEEDTRWFEEDLKEKHIRSDVIGKACFTELELSDTSGRERLLYIQNCIKINDLFEFFQECRHVQKKQFLQLPHLFSKAITD